MNDRPTPETDAVKEKAYDNINFGGCEDWCCKEWRCNSCKSRMAVDDVINVAIKLERERDEAREELHKRHNEYIEVSFNQMAEVETLKSENTAIRDALQTVRDEAFGSSPEESAIQNIAVIEKGIADLRKKYLELRDALRVRIKWWCEECGNIMYGTHYKTCRHYQTELEVTQ